MKERYVWDIKASFPYPIAASFVKLFTDECLDPGPLRLKYILATAEAIARFLGVLVLCECREHLEGKAIPVPVALNADFRSRFKRVTWGNWLHFARESLKWLQQNEASLIVEELPAFWFKAPPRESEAANAMNQLLALRNGLSHEKIRPCTGTSSRRFAIRPIPCWKPSWKRWTSCSTMSSPSSVRSRS